MKFQHIYLYAKGHYKKANVMDDLRKILAYELSISEHYVNDDFVKKIVIEIAIEHLQDDRGQMSKNYISEQLYNLVVSENKIEYSLIILTCSRVIDDEGNYIIKLDAKPDPDILPLAEVTKW